MTYYSSTVNNCSSGEYATAKNVDPAHSFIKNFGATCSEWHKLLKFEVLLVVSISLSSLFFAQVTHFTFLRVRMRFFTRWKSLAFNFKFVKSQWNHLSRQKKAPQRNRLNNFPEFLLKSKRTLFYWFNDKSTVLALWLVSAILPLIGGGDWGGGGTQI